MNAPPRVVNYVGTFCIAMAFFNVGLSAASFWAAANVEWLMRAVDPEIPTDIPEYKYAVDILRKTLFSTVVTGGVFAGLNVWLARARPTTAIYFLHLGNLVASLSGCVCIPISIPMIIAWLKKDVQIFYGVKPTEPSSTESNRTDPINREG